MNKIDATFLTRAHLRLKPERVLRSVTTSQNQGSLMPEILNAAERKRLSVQGLTHTYGGQNAVSDVSFEIEAGEIVALLGPSGCGKSTVLRAIAGLIQPKAGQIVLGEQDLANVSARSRGIGMVFQNYALFPHLTVAENIAYPLACQQVPRVTRRQRVEEMLSLVRLQDFGNRLPRELSGGQQQRVAVARAIAGRPSLLLLDEPFGALDRALRFDLQVELLHLQKTLGITTLIVTHDQEEAQSLANRLVLMNKGHVEQIDTPMAVYDRPKTLFVNTFIGQANVLSGTVLRLDADSTLIGLANGNLVLPRRLNFTVGSRVTITFRPEEVRLSTQQSEWALPVRMSVSVPLGPSLVHDLVIQDGTGLRASEVRGPSTFIPEPGMQLFAEIDTARCHAFPAEPEIIHEQTKQQR
ncbi:ATP-binding cassette domain-containing protein [Agrobacterium vitis]|uniref:ATP-binding cassette domain-containing protein n=1 Tax=Agrobacterium vitis TaxID=373 RepID=A0A1S2DVP9_AGRVI|nr:ABC transporter ATP-binding protein [Agrobacterium vitis]MCE6078419.1 ATP-binding cassette domain-containing protein [Agrobacterium vitis]MCM2453347.1 ABC transporter ATP-binding protein [Agrobacterium vitis]MUO73501.1 ATP-binding cassette domain-containing protein [Agrobacterium vitis]MUO87599.1 ATP-binding cassette domain-containing protein [Agrobacterium vitis]MUZ75950.1 ATP-binding cassette domain-containing protein [Agrobacterium vitis]